jgi:hypothetical protein
MFHFISRRIPSPDIAFAALLTVVWLLAALEVSLGVVAPLAHAGLV